MARILLIYPSQLYAPYWGERVIIKAHLLNLFSFLKSNNHDVELLDLEIEIGRPKTEEEIAEFKWKAHNLISGFDFDLVGISCWNSLNYLSSIMVAKICKNVNSDCTIAVGGYHPTARPSDFIQKEHLFDYIVRREGENAFLEIFNQQKRKENNPQIMNGIPLDLRRDIPLDWKGYRYSGIAKEVPIYLSRGCPFSCSFCMETSKELKNWRSYPIDIAVNNIRMIADTLSPTQISITDACFGYSHSWRKEFLEYLKNEHITIPFWAETRIDILDRSDIDLFSNYLFELQVGIETGSPQMLQIMNKTRHPQKFIETCKDNFAYMNKKEIPYKLLFLFNHPGETEETYSTTLDFIKSLIREQKKISGVLGSQTFSYFPGSYIAQHLREYHENFGTIIHHKEWWKQKGDHYRLSTAITPSTRLIEKIGCLDYFKKDIDELNGLMFEKMPDSLRTYWGRKM